MPRQRDLSENDPTAQKPADEQLYILSSALQQSPNAILISRLDGVIEYINPSFSRLTGYAAEEVVGRNLRLLKPRYDIGKQDRGLWETTQQGGSWRGEVRDQKRNGEIYWALESISPIRNPQGKVTHYLSIQQDITQQKRDKEALEESEARFRQMADMTGEWLWEQDAEGRYTYSSGAVREILGYDPDEIIGRRYLDLMTADDRTHWAAEFPSLAGSGHRFYRLINHYRRKDGREVFTESTGEAIVDAKGQVVKWRGVDHNITARKHYEDALRLRDRAIEAASVGIDITDARVKDHPIIYVNPALSRITGYSREEILGQSMFFLQGPDTDAASIAEIRTALEEGRSCEVVLKNYRKSGSPFWNELLIAPVRDEQGKLTHFIGIQADVTERRRAEDERHELEIARQIQLSLLPKAPLRLEHVQVFGICVPASHIGGDYFDYIHLRNHLDVVIADVSGHSVGAALIMAETRSALKAEARQFRNGGHRDHGVGETLSVLNELLYDDLDGADLFISMFYLRYSLTSRELRYANAGHNCPLLLRMDAPACVPLDAAGLILGVNKEVEFEEKLIHLEPGDRILLYTDGITEAQNEAGEFFDVPRLCGLFSAYRNDPPQAVVDKLFGELCAFCGGAPCNDDVTLVVIQAI